jgi:hypothetical protein
MDLIELLKSLENVSPKLVNSDPLLPPVLQGNFLKGSLIFPLLKECSEFSEAELSIIDSNETEKVKKCKTLLLRENTKFKGKCNLYSIYLGPTVYDPKPLLDKDSISPLMYDPVRFEPIKKISITIPIDLNKEDLKAYAINKLTKMLNNPDYYTPPGFKNILIQGDFELYECKEESKPVTFNL